MTENLVKSGNFTYFGKILNNFKEILSLIEILGILREKPCHFEPACAKMEEMGLFGRKKKQGKAKKVDTAELAQRSLDFIAEAVLVIDRHGMVKFANPAAGAMTGYGDPDNVTGLDYQLIIHLETGQGVPVEPEQSELYTALNLNRPLNTRGYVLVAVQSERRIAIDLACIPTGDENADRIVTFRDITKELAEEHEQAEFISTASHEMRTPVASIEGYLGLALNPQTATIDERARKYLEAAHSASQHLGRLFRDLLDVTKFDDSRAKAHMIPVDATEAVSYIANEQAEAMQEKKIRYSFGGEGKFTDKKVLSQKIYMAVDYDFLREIVNNLVGNAIKYTPEGGEIKVAVRGDADKVIISVADNGIGIPSEDLGHIFQKFYRVDNRQTREIGGTGLGLYLVKQRAEAMGGRVWVESDFGHGSTFYVSLPRISEGEYEQMRIAYGNEMAQKNGFVAPVVATVDVKLPNNAEITRTVTQPSGIKIKPDHPVETPVVAQSAMIQSHKMMASAEPLAQVNGTAGAEQVGGVMDEGQSNSELGAGQVDGTTTDGQSGGNPDTGQPQIIRSPTMEMSTGGTEEIVEPPAEPEGMILQRQKVIQPPSRNNSPENNQPLNQA